MKKLLSISLCLVMVLALAAGAYAISLGPISGGIPFPGGPDLGDVTTGTTKSSAEFVAAVDAIGEIDENDGVLIQTAKEKYEALSILCKEYESVIEAKAILDNAEKAYNAFMATYSTEPVAPATTSLTIGANTVEVDPALVAIDKVGASTNEYAFIVYTPAYTGEGVTNGFGVAIVVDKDGKIVRVYDAMSGNGTGSGKYFDAENAGVYGAGCTNAGYAAEAFASRKEGETVIIAPNGTAANAVDIGNDKTGTRNFLYSNRTVGAQVSGLGLTFGGSTTEPTVPSEPETPTTAPQAPTTAPQAPTTAPQAPTTAPQAPTTAPQAPTTVPQAPTTAPQAPTTQPSTPSDPVDPNGDGTFMVIALAVLSMTALVVLVSKKRAF